MPAHWINSLPGAVYVCRRVCTQPRLAWGEGVWRERREPGDYREEMKRVADAAGSGMCGLKALTGISTRFPLFPV